MKYQFVLESDQSFLSKFKNNLVTVPDTITDKGLDIPGGLMDQAIFGCKVNYTCRCTKYNSIIYEGKKCEVCGVVVGRSSERREKFGYFELNISLPNPLYSEIVLTKILKIKKNDIEMLYSSNKVFITESENGSLIFNIDDKLIKGKITFNAGNYEMGYGILALENIFKVYSYMNTPVSYFENKPNLYKSLMESPLTSIVRVIPINYREIYKVGKTKVVDSLNILYKSILSSTKRISHYKEEDPEYYLNSRFWYEVVRISEELDSLYMGGNITFKNTPIKDYSKILNRKSGLIRSGLLAKRSAFSARSVNTSVESRDINLVNNEIIIPFYMAKNILRLHIINEFNKNGINYVNATNQIDNETPELMSILRSMDSRYYVYLTRAPALYKYSLMAFKMKINFDQTDHTIKVHPLQNSPFNMDYDGDTTAVFLPITVDSQLEAANKASPSNNKFYDRDGSSIYEFTLEFIYGMYYSTNPKLGSKVDSLSIEDIYYSDYIEYEGKLITKGSLDIYNMFKNRGIDEYKLGTIINKKLLSSLINHLFITYPTNKVLELLNDLTEMSSYAFSESGLSVKFNDFIKLDKTDLLNANKIIDYNIEESKLLNELVEVAPDENAFISMFKSGTKGNHTQLKQIMISKGVLVDGDGNYLPPIKHSLMEGLSFEEFVTTIYAGRRGMVSKSLSTAITGYAYYRIVKSLRDTEIVENDCETSSGIKVQLPEALGRFMTDNTVPNLPEEYYNKIKYNPLTNKELDVMKDAGVSEVVIRSPLTCSSHRGICSKCYGINISKNAESQVNDKVGITTGSTLSEIMSQAMLRNFHTAGATDIKTRQVKSNSDIDKLQYEYLGDSENRFIMIELDNHKYLFKSDIVNINKELDIKNGEVVFSYQYDDNNVNTKFEKFEYMIDLITPKNQAIISPLAGKLVFNSIEDTVVMNLNKKLKIETPERIRHINCTIISDEGTSATLKVPFNKTFIVPFNSNVTVGQILTTGDINYKKLVKYRPNAEVILLLLSELKDIYKSQGASVRSIHLEVLVNHIVHNENKEFTLGGIMNKGLDRSYIQHLSLGYFKQAVAQIFDDLNVIGDTNADKIALGSY